MSSRSRILVTALCFLVTANASAESAVDKLMQTYAQQGVVRADAEAGKRAWNQEQLIEDDKRRCSSCHGTDLRQAGKHARTGKIIDPLAPSVNPDSLTDIDNITKWLTRNCKWTLGRECSAQEKADVLAYLKDL